MIHKLFDVKQPISCSHCSVIVLLLSTVIWLTACVELCHHSLALGIIPCPLPTLSSLEHIVAAAVLSTTCFCLSVRLALPSSSSSDISNAPASTPAHSCCLKTNSESSLSNSRNTARSCSSRAALCWLLGDSAFSRIKDLPRGG